MTVVIQTQTPKTKDSIKRFQVQHKNTMAIIKSEFKEAIEVLDPTATDVRIEIRQTILSQTNN